MGTQAYSGVSVPYFGGRVARKESVVQTADGVGTLTEADNNSTIMLNAASGAVITLPAVTLTGFSVKFITGALFATADWAITSAEGTNMEGSLIVAGAVVTVAAASAVTLELGADNIGDFVEVFSDGTNWHVFGNALTAVGITAA